MCYIHTAFAVNYTVYQYSCQINSSYCITKGHHFQKHGAYKQTMGNGNTHQEMETDRYVMMSHLKQIFLSHV